MDGTSKFARMAWKTHQERDKMTYFEYDRNDPKAEYYELLQELIVRWEYEIVEFKEAKGGYSEDRIGQYFSAISNEANLEGKQYGWFILGVSENGEKHPVGTAFKEGPASLLERFKYTISSGTTDAMTFLEIVELFPVADAEERRVLMFKIPAAVAGMPTEWKNRCFARSGESLIPMQQYKIDAIRSQERRDWSKLLLSGARIEHLDQGAIALAREKYKERRNQPHITEEVDSLTDEEFLTKIQLMRNGQVTNAAMILLGKADCDQLFENPPCIMWRLYGSDGMMKDYELFHIPFINVVDQVSAKIRNLTYRYMPNQLSLFPKETQQYDAWLLRELLNNCIAHSNHQLGGRIYVNECEDSIIITNPGDFLPQSIETVLQPTYSPPSYRNRLLTDSMTNFHMIETASSGIKRIYQIQKKKYFPMPDYDFSTLNQVSVTVYGKTIDEQYTYILYDHPELDLETVYLLDQVQKGKSQNLSKEAVAHLRKYKLVEGRVNHLFLSADVAKSVEEEAQYIQNKAFDDQYYRDMIIDYLETFGKAQRKDFRKLLLNKLPDSMTEAQKERKILTLLTALKRQGKIETDSNATKTCNWIIKK